MPKYHKRIDVLGNVDELISYIGLIRSQDISADDKEILIMIQDRLMVCAAILATEIKKNIAGLPELKDNDILVLERAIDKTEDQLPELNSFILPGGHTLVSYCHIARAVCRKAERKVVRLSAGSYVPEAVIKYLNRLSDYLFVLARRLSASLNSEEILWKPEL